MPDYSPSPSTQLVLSRLAGVKPTKDGWQAKCKAHEDGTASLSISEGDDGRTLIHCQAACPPEAVLSAIGLKLSNLYNNKSQTNGKRVEKASYDYTDETGNLLFQV